MSRGFRSIARKWFTRLLMVFVLFLCSDDGGTVEAAGELKRTQYYSLPDDVTLWNQHIKMVRALMSTQQLSGFKTNERHPEGERYVTTEDFFNAPNHECPTTDGADPQPTIDAHVWKAISMAVFVSFYLGAGSAWKWLVNSVPFGNAKQLVAKLRSQVGTKDAQMQRLTNKLDNHKLLSAHHYFQWFGEFNDLVDNYNLITDIGVDEITAARKRVRYVAAIAKTFPSVTTHADNTPHATVESLHTLVETAVSHGGNGNLDQVRGEGLWW